MKESRTPDHGSIECFSYLKKHDLENYVKEIIADPKGDEEKAQEGFSQSQEDYFCLHWISYVTSLLTPKDMFGKMTSLYEEKNINGKVALRNHQKNVKI